MTHLTAEELMLKIMKVEAKRLALIIDGVENSNSAAEVALENWYLKQKKLSSLEDVQ